MGNFGTGWVPVRRGVMEHVFDGSMTPEEHHVVLSMLLLADAETGVWRGSAKSLTTILRRSERAMTVALQGLESKGYILRDYLLGKQGNFPIIIGEFHLTRGSNLGKRVDLVATRKKFGIPDGPLHQKCRKPLRGAISSACKTPVLRAGTTSGVNNSSSAEAEVICSEDASSSAEVKVDFAEVSIRERRERGREEGVGAPSLRSDDPVEAESPSRCSEDSKTIPNPEFRSPPFFKAKATPEMPPAEQLATLFYSYHGHSAKFDNEATFRSWTTGFEGLVAQHGLEMVSGAMKWAFEVDDFWPPKLLRANEPLEYLGRMLQKNILPRYIGSQMGKRNSARKEQERGNTNEQPKAGSTASNRRGKQPLDNSAASAEVKRRIAERGHGGV